jgi:hypothetical protein
LTGDLLKAEVRDGTMVLHTTYSIGSCCQHEKTAGQSHLKLLKIAARIITSARYKYFKLCSSCPYKKEFYETMENIWKLQTQSG